MVPDEIRYKIFSIEDFIHQRFQIALLIIITVYENHTIFSQQPPGYFQTILHKRQPRGVVELIVVAKAVITRVVRRVNVDQLHPAPKAGQQRMERQ